MKDTTLALRYAKAYLSLASQRGDTEEAVRGAQQATAVLEQCPAAKEVLLSPLVPSCDKARALVRAMGDAVAGPAKDLTAFVVEKGRANVLPEIFHRIVDLYRQERGIRLAEATSAVELSEGQKEELSRRLKELAGAREILLECKVDPALLGGIRVKVGDRVWDGSLAGRLEEIREKFL